jgi:small GTP-binding protein
VFVDSVSTFLDMGVNEEDTLDKIGTLIKELNLQGVFIISLFVDWGYDNKIVARVKDIFENIVELKPVERQVIFLSYFNVSKKFGKKNGNLEFPFKVLKPGGVRVFIPKILVTGPYHAGKSSFVQSASTRAVSVNRVGTTIALDFGHVDLGGFAVDLFGTPGQERFDPILELLAGESLGVILVVDSTKPETFGRAMEMVEKTRTTGLPIVIAANKSDLPGALTIKGIKKRMGLPADIPVLPLTAEQASVAKEGEPCKLSKTDISKIMGNLLGQVV